MPYFICPNCKQRSIDVDRKEGLYDEAVACHHCGFGFLFELLDDYYPAPATGMVVCDREGRILAVGRGGFEAERNPAQLALEWGVRRLNEKLELRTRNGYAKAVTGDFFPAYDDDGGL